MLREGKWTGWAPTQLLGMDVKGKTLGLVGFGRIAKEAARRVRARAHGASLITRAVGPVLRKKVRSAPSIPRRWMSLLAASDVVSLHCPGVRPRAT